MPNENSKPPQSDPLDSRIKRILSSLRPKERAIVEKRLSERPAHVDPDGDGPHTFYGLPFPAHVDPKPTIAPGTMAGPDLCPACRGTGIDNGVCHNCGGWGSVTVYHQQGRVFSDRPWEPKKWGHR